VKRADVSSAAPHFTRDNPVVDTPADQEQKTREQELEEAAEKAKAQLGTIEEQKERLKIVIAQRERDLHEARDKYHAAVKDLDDLVRAEEVAGRSRKPIHDILDFVKSQREHREARAKARQGG
jgi:multidrug efflux pump subunit AcrA (membrane-fusion protein)